MKAIIRDIDNEQNRLDQKQKALAAQVEVYRRKAEGLAKVKAIIYEYDLAPPPKVRTPAVSDQSLPSFAKMILTVVGDHCEATGQGLKTKSIAEAITARFKPVTSTQVAQVLVKLKRNGDLDNVGGYYVSPDATQTEKDAA